MSSAADTIAHICMFDRTAGEGAASCGVECVNSFGLVDCKFFRSWSRWPRYVVMHFGRCFVTNFLLRPGNESKYPLSIAFNRVDLTGKPRDAWWNWARSFFVVSESMMALHVCWVFCVGELSSMLMIHMPFVINGSRLPMRITSLCLLRIINFSRENIAVQS